MIFMKSFEVTQTTKQEHVNIARKSGNMPFAHLYIHISLRRSGGWCLHNDSETFLPPTSFGL